jgi:hypothetical protein
VRQSIAITLSLLSLLACTSPGKGVARQLLESSDLRVASSEMLRAYPGPDSVLAQLMYDKGATREQLAGITRARMQVKDLLKSEAAAVKLGWLTSTPVQDPTGRTLYELVFTRDGEAQLALNHSPEFDGYVFQVAPCERRLKSIIGVFEDSKHSSTVRFFYTETQNELGRAMGAECSDGETRMRLVQRDGEWVIR